MSDGATVVIPARFGSVRLPGKPLLDETGKPLIQHVVERVGGARRVERVVVATDDQRIERAVRGAGAEAVMTSAEHPNGTSRIAEAIERLGLAEDAKRVVVNVQGDEPEIEPTVIDGLIAALSEDSEAEMATVGSAFAEGEDPADPNIVKVVTDRRGRALYFSRALIPHMREPGAGTEWPLKHVGVYAYRAGFLRVYVKLEPGRLEGLERLEQLRVLEHGYGIAVVRADVSHHGIDTRAGYEAFVRRMRAT